MSERNCITCVWKVDGVCQSWECDYINRADAIEAYKRMKEMRQLINKNKHIRENRVN